jgi:S-(hydroxymethyl)glutathione dehydrogenase/alcohol dehydrogenase
MAETFRAAVLVSPNKPLEIMDLRFPELKDGQVLVRNIASGVCRSQLMEAKGKRGEDKWLPHLLGHEGVGVVEKIGPHVTKVKIGQKVVIGWIVGQGNNSMAPQFSTANGININSGAATTFSEYSVVSENRVYIAPEGFSDYFLPLFGCALLTGGGMALNHFDRELHKSVLVLGFGGVGSSAAVVLDSFNSTKIVILDESEARRNQAILMGFSHVYSLEEFESNDGNNSNNKFDLCIESAGYTESIELGFSLLSKTGRLVFASHPESGARISLDPFEMINGKLIFGSFGGGSNPEEDIKTISKLLHESRLNLEYMLGDVFALEDVNQALKQLEMGQPGRPLIRMLGTRDE